MDQTAHTMPTLSESFPSLEYIRALAGSVVKKEWFKRTIVILIALNAIWMGIFTFDFVTENPSIYRIFEIVDHVFLWIFTLELGLKFCYHGLALFQNGVLVFDFLMIVFSWVFHIQFPRVGAFRIFRALRLMSQVERLRRVIKALVLEIPHMLAIFTVLLLIYYIFAVVFTSLFKHLYRDGLTEEDYFSRLDTTAFTLFQLMTTDGWSQITKEVMETYNWAWFPIIAFMVISIFVVVNLVVGVISDAIGSMQQAQTEKELKEIQTMTWQATMGQHQDFLRMEQKMELLLQQQMQLQEEIRLLKSSS